MEAHPKDPSTANPSDFETISDQDLLQSIAEAQEDVGDGFFSNPDPEFFDDLKRLEDLAKARGLI